MRWKTTLPMRAEWIHPDWPVPKNVRALSTTRTGGVSTGVYTSLNLAEHVGDVPASVNENRSRLQKDLGDAKPGWLKQVHGTRVARLDGQPVASPADASVTGESKQACVIMTADCLPVLLCDAKGTQVAAAHAGWRGLAAGVLEAAVAEMRSAPADVMAWLGPAIGSKAYEVGGEVRQAFVAQDAAAAEAFKPGRSADKWWCDLYMLARQRLKATGVRQIYGGGFCTYTERGRFFSYRRDGECGRMATLIWLE
jgi:YfiH family protein